MKKALISRGAAHVLLLATLAMNGWAISPRNVLLLINAGSMDSKEVANHFVQLRHIPAKNVVYLDLPDKVYGARAELSRDEFLAWVWEPAWKAIWERSLEHDILAWVYSADFPVKIEGDPPVSLQGITFTGGQSVNSEVIKKGTILSPYFTGPDRPKGLAAPTRSFEQYYEHLQGKIATPSMMLGYTGARGMKVVDIIGNLQRGVASDGTRPEGRIYLVEGSDVRARCRAWQFPAVKQQLKDMNIQAAIVPSPPVGKSEIMGNMAGTATVDPRSMGTFRAGCMADHLTSFGAAFVFPEQTKITEWLQAGATASAGTVSEPFALWTKFPHARFFVHYASGCSMIESFYQALAAPMQTLLLGEPLARPWADPVSMSLVNLQAGAISGKARFTFHTQPEYGPDLVRVMVYMDDNPFDGLVGKSVIEFDGRELSDGYHELSVVAYYDRGAQAVPLTAACSFVVNNKGRSVALSTSAGNTNADLYHPLALQLSVAGSNAISFEITSAGRVIKEGSWPTKEIRVDPAVPGPGPVTFEARVRFDDSTVVASPPLVLTIGRYNQPPFVERIDEIPDGEGWTRYRPQFGDAEKDAVLSWWLCEVPIQRPHFLKRAETTAGRIRFTSKMALLSPEGTGSFSTCFFPFSMPEGEARYSAELAVSPDWPVPLTAGYTGLAFSRQPDGSYGFFGISKIFGAWVLGVVKDGHLVPGIDCGTPIRPDSWYRLAVIKRSDGWVEGWVGDERVCQMRLDEGYDRGPVGLVTSVNEAGFRNVCGSINMLPQDDWRLNPEGLSLPNKQDHGFDRLVVQASDGFNSSFKKVDVTHD